jgi:hypothetical protein
MQELKEDEWLKEFYPADFIFEQNETPDIETTASTQIGVTTSRVNNKHLTTFAPLCKIQ